MAKGKKLSVISGIITLVATFLFSWIALEIGRDGTIYYANGLGIIQNLPAMFTDAESIGSTLAIPVFAFYIIAGIFILFLASGVLQILGKKHRAFVIVGTIVSLGIAILLLLSNVNVIDKANWVYYILGTDEPLIENIIPLKILGLGTFDIGMYLLLAGGIVGIFASVYEHGPF
ncbi:MAG: hypothetical protein V3V33_01795 [Candidatus Lokiarchaeia archaeon]